MESGKQREFEGRVIRKESMRVPKPIKPWVWILTVVGFCMGTCFPLWLDPITNYAGTVRLAQVYEGVDHPEDTGVIRSFGVHGSYYTERDYCLILVGEVRWSTVPRAQLIEFYQTDIDRTWEGDYGFDIHDYDEPSNLPLSRYPGLTQADFEAAEEKGGFPYVAYFYQVDMEGFDLMCW